MVMEQIANLSTGNRRQGSNPCLSAQVKSQRTTLAFLRQSVSPSLLVGNVEGAKKNGAATAGSAFRLSASLLRDHERRKGDASTPCLSAQVIKPALVNFDLASLAQCSSYEKEHECHGSLDPTCDGHRLVEHVLCELFHVQRIEP